MAQSRVTVRWAYVALVVAAVAILGGAGWYAYARGGKTERPAEKKPGGQPRGAPGEVPVDVVKVLAGGLERVCTQPGSVEPFESADVYAKVSGYLKVQMLEREKKGKDGKPVLDKDGKPVIEPVLGKDGKPIIVNIGTRVQAGDILARISVPEYEKEVDRAKAQIRDAEAKVKQMVAHIEAAKAEAKAAEASIALARVMVKAKTAYRHYREKQLTRIKGLAADKAVDAKLVDEEEDHFLAAQEAENAATEQVNSSTEKANAAKAKVDQAVADKAEAEAMVGVYEAELGKAEDLLNYTIIRSKYTGVVTKRNFFPGDFIKSAAQDGKIPMLSVERTDIMTVVVQVPDRDVRYLNVGDPALIEVDALPGVVIKTDDKRAVAVSRIADAEDPATRTMRTEIDVPNTDGMLRHGMYGRVSITLTDGTPNAVRVPSAALFGRAENGKGKARVVRDGKVHIVPVQYATDNGVWVEVVSGLKAGEDVITRANGPVEEGTPVKVNAVADGGH